MNRRNTKRLGFEALERRALLAVDLGGICDNPMGPIELSNSPVEAASAAVPPIDQGDALDSGEFVQIEVPSGLPGSFVTTVELRGESWTLELEKHSVFGPNTRFLIDDGSGTLEEVDPGVDRSYLGTVVGRPDYAVSAVLTEAGLMANIIRPNLPSIVVEPAPAGTGPAMHRVFVDEYTAIDNHEHGDHDGHDEHGEGDGDTASFTGQQAEVEPSNETVIPPQAIGTATSTATLPPTRVIQVREFEVGVEIGSAALLNNYSGSTIDQKKASAMAEAQKIPGNLDARYLHGAGVKHRLGTVIIRTGSDPFTVQNGNDNAGLSAFRNYWNSNPQEVGTTHDLAVYHVRARPSGLAYVNSVGTSSRYALTASEGPSSWANGTLVHEFGHSWSLGHVPSNPSNTYYESKPRNNSGSNSAGGSDVFVSVMHGGGSHNIGRLSSGEANRVYNVSQNKTQFGDLVTPGAVKPFGRVDFAVAVDEPLVIDVVANDYDANNDVLDVDLLDTVSQKGGTISLSMGTGPGGRHEIVYTAPAGGFSGTDFFHYTVFDTTGRTDWGAVYVDYQGAVVVDTTLTKYDYDFGTPTSPVHSNSTIQYVSITPDTFGEISWSNPVSAIDRGGNVNANANNRDFVTSNSVSTLEHKIAIGLWRVTLNMGDATTARDDMAVWAEGSLISNDIDSPAGQYSYVDRSGASSSSTSFLVQVNDGSLSLTFDDLGGSDSSWVLNRMSLSLEQAGASTLDLYVDQSTGQAVVKNNTDGDIAFDGYAFRDTATSMLVNEWYSLQDRGHQGGDWFEAGDSAANPTFLAELAYSGETVLAPGEQLYFGEIVNPSAVANLTFEYVRTSSGTTSFGTVHIGDVGVPILPGDFNHDFRVDLADYSVWRDQLGASVRGFEGADASGNGVVDGEDYTLWKRNFGANLDGTSLINASQGNGQFAVDDASQVSGVGIDSGSITVDLARDRALVSVGQNAVGNGVDVDGWTVTRVSLPGGNNAIGVDGNYGFAPNAGTGPGQSGQAFVNSGVAEVTSDPVAGSFNAGDELVLSYLLGTDSSPTAQVRASATLLFNAGQETEFSHSFDIEDAVGLTSLRRLHRYTLPTDANSVIISIQLDGIESGRRTVVDDVTLDLIQGSGAAIAALTTSAAKEVDDNAEVASLATSVGQVPVGIASLPLGRSASRLPSIDAQGSAESLERRAVVAAAAFGEWAPHSRPSRAMAAGPDLGLSDDIEDIGSKHGRAEVLESCFATLDDPTSAWDAGSL